MLHLLQCFAATCGKWEPTKRLMRDGRTTKKHPAFGVCALRRRLFWRQRTSRPVPFFLGGGRGLPVWEEVLSGLASLMDSLVLCSEGLSRLKTHTSRDFAIYRCA